jgi:hypothetical protein
VQGLRQQQERKGTKKKRLALTVLFSRPDIIPDRSVCSVALIIRGKIGEKLSAGQTLADLKIMQRVGGRESYLRTSWCFICALRQS